MKAAIRRMKRLRGIKARVERDGKASAADIKYYKKNQEKKK